MALPLSVSIPFPVNDINMSHSADDLANWFGSFERMDNGLYIASASSADEPKYLKAVSNIDYDGISYLSTRVEWNKNALVPGAKDDRGEMYIVFRGSLRRFSPKEVSAGIAACSVPFRAQDLAPRFYRGER